MKVLVAEDDPVSRTVLRKTVEKLGHECLVAEDGVEAWEAYQNTPDVDVIISDWMMPNTFASGLRSILRNDPDDVMVGEIRDAETAKTGVEVALTGHLVLATLHTNDAPGALSRLAEMGVEPFLIASAVDCVIAQRLARKLCESCKRPAEIDEEILSGLASSSEHLGESEPRFHEAVGCAKCGGSGYRGRTGLYELMPVTDHLKGLILHRASPAEISRAAGEEGMTHPRDDGLMKAARGVTTIEEVLRTVV